MPHMTTSSTAAAGENCGKITIRFTDRNANKYTETRTKAGHATRLATLELLEQNREKYMPTHFGSTDFLYHAEAAAIRAAIGGAL